MDVIGSLPDLLFPLHQSLRNFTFFITPEFIEWFDEENKFLDRVLEHIHRNWFVSLGSLGSPTLSQEDHRKIVSRVAVVDRLPFPGGNSSGCPGITLAVTAGHELPPTASQPLVESERHLPYITVETPFPNNNDDEQKSLSILLRPANTLFVNGLQATMFADEWVLNRETTSRSKISRKGPRQRLNRLSWAHVAQSASFTVPLQKLTEPREIAMCMGNVISKLVGEQNSELFSASLELEQKVSSFMRSKSTTDGRLAVFALIAPKTRLSIQSMQRPVIPTEFLGCHNLADTDHAITEEERTRDFIRLAISEGAHLHRVTSGGGGWGKKKGLLSLEPAMDFGSEDSDSHALEILEDFEGTLEQDRPVWSQHQPQIARPGDLIQFYGIFTSKEGEEALIRKESTKTALKVPSSFSWHPEEWIRGEVSTTIWGVIPPQDSSDASTFSTLGNNLITIPHQFGMLSESGMALQRLDGKVEKQAPGGSRVTARTTTSITRIDVPHAVLTYSGLTGSQPK